MLATLTPVWSANLSTPDGNGGNAPEEEPQTNFSVVGSPQDCDPESQLGRFAELIPEERRREFLSVMETTISHRGWLPPPHMLAEYNAVLPGLAERIVQMPEREQAFRHEIFRGEGKREFTLKRWGQHYAIISMLIVIGFAVFLTFMGEPAWASRVVIATLAVIVGIFITGKVADLQAAKAERHEEGDGDSPG
jgi:uncharacterized membrane protein